jgi:hypothetical protein
MKSPMLLVSLPLLSTLTASGANPNLTGTVRTEAGQPLAAATVFIYTAGPKVGVGTL